MKINTDLHIHSKYSIGSSPKMILPIICFEARKKGIQLMGTGDCIHPKWLSEIKKHSIDNETIEINEIALIPTTEIEDKNRVHHLLILPSISKAEELSEILSKYGNLETDGRPNIKLDGACLAQIAKDIGALIGPCHAFTPWTALYGFHDSLRDCYGDLTKYISFIELGLSADANYADRIKELENLTFLTNSDAHSPWLNKLAREFTQFNMPDTSFEGLKKAILRIQGYGALLNVGFYPEEGKYNRSACIKCFKIYNFDECKARNWKCVCGKRIKKGVFDRVNELANFDNPKHPKHRPDYLHTIPLSEIIKMALNHKSVNTKGVKLAWELLIKTHGNEIKILTNVPIRELDCVNKKIINAICAFRNKSVIVNPGGGGNYGSIQFKTGMDK